jgi:hypothetical protein
MDRGKTGEVMMTKADEDAIREIELRFNQAWGRHDPDAMVESLVDDAQFVTVNGAWNMPLRENASGCSASPTVSQATEHPLTSSRAIAA